MNTQINTNGLLTPREEQAMLFVAQGKTIKDAARVMRIARDTTYGYVDQAKNKLNAETTPHAVSLLWAQGHIKYVACLFLGLCLWLPITESLLDQNTAIARRGAGGKARRTGRSKTDSDLFTIDPDTGALSWPCGANNPEQTA
jgi:DNA-binding CsgD family transcriptional regulator